MKRRLAVLATHPIQYFSPLFRHLSGMPELDLSVYYCIRPTPEMQGMGFGVPFEWDTDLLSGYRHFWLDNVSRRPGLDRFGGCDTPGIGRVIEEEKFDAFMVLGWNKKSFWQAMSACRRSRTPLLVRGDSQLAADRSFLKRAVKRAVYPRFMARFSACLATGKRSEEYFTYYGAKRVILSPHFADNEWFARRSDEAARSREALKKEWGLPPGKFVLLFAGKFEQKKRPMDVLVALRCLTASGENKFHLLMAGEGALRGACETYAKKNGLPVSFAGFVNQSRMPSVYSVSDGLVLPSDARETWGLVVNEAMACGVPAIVSERAGCVPDLIEEGRTGYSYPCGDAAALAVRMRSLEAEAGRGSMRGHAKDRAARYGVEGAARGIVQALEAAHG